MATSQISIVNSALLKLGAERITALDGSNKSARICEEQYPKMRDMVLADHPWNFAIKRVELASTANKPVFEYDYEFQLPSDCIRVLNMENPDYVWVREGDKLLTNESIAKIRYISRVTTEALYSPPFAEALAWRLAVDLSYNLIQQPALSGQLMDEYKLYIRDLRMIDAQEGTPPDLMNDSFINSRA